MKYTQKLHDNLRRQQESDRFDTHTDFTFTILLDEIDRLTSLVNRMKEDGEVLQSRLIKNFGNRWHCTICLHSNYSGNVSSFNHAPDCPVTLHRQLMTEIEDKKW